MVPLHFTFFVVVAWDAFLLRVRPLVLLPVCMDNWRPQTFWAVNNFSGIETVNDVLELLDVSDSPPDLIKKSWALKVPQRCCVCHYPHDNICLCGVHLGSHMVRQAAAVLNSTPAILNNFSQKYLCLLIITKSFKIFHYPALKGGERGNVFIVFDSSWVCFWVCWFVC